MSRSIIQTPMSESLNTVRKKNERMPDIWTYIDRQVLKMNQTCVGTHSWECQAAVGVVHS